MSEAQALSAARWWGGLLLLVAVVWLVALPWRAQLAARLDQLWELLLGPTDGVYDDD